MTEYPELMSTEAYGTYAPDYMSTEAPGASTYAPDFMSTEAPDASTYAPDFMSTEAPDMSTEGGLSSMHTSLLRPAPELVVPQSYESEEQSEMGRVLNKMEPVHRQSWRSLTAE